MTVAAEKSQTTPEFKVEGTDIFSFGTADAAPGPGDGKPEPATLPPTGDNAGEANDKEAGGSKLEAGSEEENAAEKLRFKDHQAAEEGYRNLQSKATRAEQEAADLRRKLAEVEQQKAEQAEQQAHSGKAAEIEKAIDDYTAERNEKALEEIEGLDPDDPEHRKKVARIWGNFHSDVRRFAAKPVDGEGKQLEAGGLKLEAGRKEEAAPVEKKPVVTAPDPAAVEKRRSEIKSYIDGKARSAGIDPEADELWAGVALTTPATDDEGKAIPLDQQIDWTINRYNERKAAIMARARQEGNLPLGEGGHVSRQPGGARGKAPDGPISLGDAVARANERRRL
jgi:hypothetical protein